MRRGQEPLNHNIWKPRIEILVKVLKTKPMTAKELCRYCSKNLKWGAGYTVNVLAAGDIQGYVENNDDNIWTVAVS